MRYETFIDGDWLEQIPAETGQRYRLYDDSGGVIESYWAEPVIDTRTVYTISSESVQINSESASQFTGNYYAEPNDTITLIGSITDDNGDVVTSITVPITLKMPLVRHANAQPTTDEIYLNVTLQSGIMTATGTIPHSGDWKILTERTNQALQRIGAEWALSHPDVTFLV